jgi:YggT family protein
MRLLDQIIDLYSLVVLAAVIMSWIQVSPHNTLATAVNRLTEPALAPIRRLLPTTGGLDFSPMVLLFILQALKSVLHAS